MAAAKKPTTVAGRATGKGTAAKKSPATGRSVAKKAAGATKRAVASSADSAQTPTAVNAAGGATRARTGGKTVAAKAAAKKVAAKKVAAEKSSARTTSARRASAQESSVQEPSAQESSAQQAEGKNAAAQKAAQKKSPARKSPATKAAAKRSTAKRSAPGAVAKKRASAAKKTRTAGSTNQDAGATATSSGARAKVPEGWSAADLEELRELLLQANQTLAAEIAAVTGELDDLAEDAANAAGDDQADTGSRAFERDQGMQVVANARELMEQNTRALERMDKGTYGICESCGNTIPAGRLRVHPGATLCVACKSAQERR
ncbi:MAG: TraR/DksA C4-type zinc finger protein [Actinomycetales bacterium]